MLHLKNIPKANYVCTICSQTFTRRWRGNTNSINLHSGNAKIVRLVDYIVGRLDGQYFAGDPSLYRSKNRMFCHMKTTALYPIAKEFLKYTKKNCHGR